MKNKIKNFSIILLILIILFVIIPIKGYCVEDIISGMSGATTLVDGKSVTTGLNTILSLVRFVGSGISIIVVLMLGIKYMIASIDEKVEIKKRAIPIVIGCVILFATTNILVIINGFVTDISTP